MSLIWLHNQCFEWRWAFCISSNSSCKWHARLSASAALSPLCLSASNIRRDCRKGHLETQTQLASEGMRAEFRKCITPNIVRLRSCGSSYNLSYAICLRLFSMTHAQRILRTVLGSDRVKFWGRERPCLWPRLKTLLRSYMSWLVASWYVDDRCSRKQDVTRLGCHPWLKLSLCLGLIVHPSVMSVLQGVAGDLRHLESKWGTPQRLVRRIWQIHYHSLNPQYGLSKHAWGHQNRASPLTIDFSPKTRPTSRGSLVAVWNGVGYGLRAATEPSRSLPCGSWRLSTCSNSTSQTSECTQCLSCVTTCPPCHFCCLSCALKAPQSPTAAT